MESILTPKVNPDNYKSTLVATPSKSLTGQISIAGDKSISHRAIMLSSQAIGTTEITGLLESDDVLHTVSALQKMGVDINKREDDVWIVNGVGVGGLSEPDDILDMGNSGTAVRLMMGLVSPYEFTTTFTGDESLRGRPMGRVTTPLWRMGAEIEAREVDDKYFLPISIKGNGMMIPTKYRLPVASAQVKSAILLAGLNIPGVTLVIEPVQTRDHTEKMLSYLGADIKSEPGEDGQYISIVGQPELTAKPINVPGDPSSASFPMVAALITPESDIVIENVMINPHRTGLFRTLFDMGANISLDNQRDVAGEPVANLRIKYSKLHGVKVPAKRVPSMIDEFPILAIAASVAEGKTVMEGLSELRVKESDRLDAICKGLKACGVEFESGDDWLIIHGRPYIKGGGTVNTFMDHRIAMSFLIAGGVSKEPIKVDSGEMIKTSFPGFVELMNALGTQLSPS